MEKKLSEYKQNLKNILKGLHNLLICKCNEIDFSENLTKSCFKYLQHTQPSIQPAFTYLKSLTETPFWCHQFLNKFQILFWGFHC